MKRNALESPFLVHGQDLYDLDVIAREIAAYTGESAETVWRRLAWELDQTGFNVVNETRRFGVTPHVFDQAMIDFYTKSDGFIYETSIGNRDAYRVSKWLRIAEFIAAPKPRLPGRRVLVYGDSIGNDCIFLSRMGCDVSYHDFESYCAGFARGRFASRSLTIRPFQPGSADKFDYIICFEVAEHVPDPKALVAELASLTGENGYCIFSESFAMIEPAFPTHLRTNLEFVGKDDALFAAHGMAAEWKDGEAKPIVYTRHPTPVKVALKPKVSRVRKWLRALRRKALAAYHA